MVPELYAMISDALEAAKEKPRSREMSLVITKLEEALMWFGATTHQVPRNDAPLLRFGAQP